MARTGLGLLLLHCSGHVHLGCGQLFYEPCSLPGTHSRSLRTSAFCFQGLVEGRGPFSETLRKGLNTVFLGATISVGSSGWSGHLLAEDSLRRQDGRSYLHRTEEKHPGIHMGPNTSSPRTMTDGRWYTGIPALSPLTKSSLGCVFYTDSNRSPWAAPRSTAAVESTTHPLLAPFLVLLPHAPIGVFLNHFPNKSWGLRLGNPHEDS